MRVEKVAERPLVRRRSQAERRSDTRAALVASARERLCEVGVHGVTVSAIARGAGVSQGSVFHHFAGKDELIAVAMAAHVADLQAAHLEALMAVEDPRERIERAVDAVWAVYQDPSIRASFDILVAARTDPAVASMLREADRRSAALTRSGAAELMQDLSLEEGQIDAIVGLVGYALQGLALADLHGIDPGEVEQTLATVRRVAVDLALASAAVNSNGVAG